MQGTVEGTDYEFRAFAVNYGRNRTTTPIQHVLVPFDDSTSAAGLLAYSGSGWETMDPWSGSSDYVPLTTKCPMYVNTLHVTRQAGDSVTIAFTGTRVAVTGPAGGGGGTIGVTLDGAALPEETLTVTRLGLIPSLLRTFKTTNPVESMISIARDAHRYQVAPPLRAWPNRRMSRAESRGPCSEIVADPLVEIEQDGDQRIEWRREAGRERGARATHEPAD